MTMTKAAEHKQPLLKASLEGLANPPPALFPQWLLHQKENAATKICERGLPRPKEEAWRSAPLGALVSVPFAPVSGNRDQAGFVLSAAVREDANSLGIEPIVLLDGQRLNAACSGIAAIPEGLAFHFGRVASLDVPWVALNTAFVSDPVWLALDAKDAGPHIAYVVHARARGQEPTMMHDRITISLAPGSRWTVIEHFVGQPPPAHALLCANAVTEVIMAPEAELEHVRIYEGTARDYTLHHVAVRQELSSRYSSRTLSVSGALRREDVMVLLADQQSTCSLEGLYVVNNADFSGHYTQITHANLHTQSHQHYRGVLGQKGVAVFDGTVAIKQDAQDSHAHQENRNLLLSPDAVVHTKPQLKIDADNVTCSHAATVGHLNDEQLFYLRARGIGPSEAKSMLILAFLKELTAGSNPESLRKCLEKKVAFALRPEIQGPS